MRNTRILPALLYGFCLPLLLPGQQNKLLVSPSDQIAVKSGESVRASIKVATLPGFHVNSDKPKDDFLIPLSLTWTAGPLKTQSVTYPKPEELKVGNETLSVFTGAFAIETLFKAPQGIATGAAAMTGKLHYQACNNQMCFRPSTLEIRLPIVIEQ